MSEENIIFFACWGIIILIAVLVIGVLYIIDWFGINNE